jgi:hypothetical protein
MALYGRDLLLPLTGHLDGTSGRRWSRHWPSERASPKAALFPTSADRPIISSKPEAADSPSQPVELPQAELGKEFALGRLKLRLNRP